MARKAKGASRKAISPHHGISFDNRQDFERFVKSIPLLMCIQSFRPSSVYELSKMVKMDQSNLSKLVAFLESVGAVEIVEKKSGGRLLRRPVVDYEKVEFSIGAA